MSFHRKVGNYLVISDAFAQEVVKDANTQHINTDIGFLNQHKGLRPGKLHLFIGKSGGGKSTIFKTVFCDFMTANPNMKAGVWYTEEDEEDFLAQFVELPNYPTLLKASQNKRLQYYSEIDHYKSHYDEALTNKQMIQKIEEIMNVVDVFFFDNLTTAEAYSSGTSIKGQEVFSKTLKALSKKTNTCLVLLAHTGGQYDDFSNRKMSQNDIRGPKSVVNLAEYIYLIEGMKINDGIQTFLTIDKARMHSPKNNYFKMDYCPDTKTYHHSYPVTFDDFNNAFSLRNTLKTKSNRDKESEVPF